MFNLEEELKKLPASPGVYLMHDKYDHIIYVGKAISLKNRVRQYFQSSRKVTAKIEKMIQNIAYFEYIVTDSELEALVLECNLIKEYNPKYNTLLKDDKAYPFIKATVGEMYPRLLMVRQMKKSSKKHSEKVKYFGPYTSVGAMKDVLELLRKGYKVRTCNRNLPKDTGKERPCLYYQIKQCDAPCQGYINEQEYKENFTKAMDVLQGNYKELLKHLNEKMMQAAENMEYEDAAEYRDLLQSVKVMSQKQKLTNSEMEDWDIIGIARTQNEAVIQIFFMRSGRMIGREHFFFEGVDKEENPALLAAFMKQFYSGTPYIPREIFLPGDIEERQVLEAWLSEKRGQKVTFTLPQKGQKERLVELACNNASMVLQKDRDKVKREKERTIGAMKEIEEMLGLKELHRVESYDISNISGFQSVGSMVVFEDGKPKKNNYRKFKIKTIEGPNDYGSMKEVLTRRFSHGIRVLNEEKADPFRNFPDLILMDGGKGQVNIALEVLEELQLHIPVCGMVKDDHHRTRGLYFNNVELPMDTRSESFKLVTRIQDETHRFAITFHRALRSKEQVHSVLDDIPNVGEKRKRVLLENFLSIEEIKNASLEQLRSLPQMNAKAAQSIYTFFHSNGDKALKDEENHDKMNGKHSDLEKIPNPKGTKEN